MALWMGFSVQFWNGTPLQIPILSLVTTSNMTFWPFEKAHLGENLIVWYSTHHPL